MAFIHATNLVFAWVGGNAKVYEDAKVYDNAEVYGDHKVGGDTQVSGDHKVGGNKTTGKNGMVQPKTEPDNYTISPKIFNMIKADIESAGWNISVVDGKINIS